MADSATTMCLPVPNHSSVPSHPHSVNRNDDPPHTGMPTHVQPISKCSTCMANQQQEVIEK